VAAAAVPHVTDGLSTLVVVGFAEALAAPEVVWSLIDAGCHVAAFARCGKAAAIRHSRYVALHDIPAPESDAEAAISALRGALDELRSSGQHERHVLLALDDAALWLCSRVGADGWSFAGPSKDRALALALDKRHQIEAARDAGLEVLPTLVVRTPPELDAGSLAFPLILRPADAVRVAGGRLRKGRNWICADAAELAAARDAWAGTGDLLVQPYVDGTGEGVFGLATDHGVVAWSAHRRLRMMNPHGSGSSACISRSVESALQEPVSRMLEAAGWRGIFMIEFLRSSEGRLLFVEFNGRAWGSLALGRRQGLEYPAWTVNLALGDPIWSVVTAGIREGLVCRHLGRELMHLLFVLRGPKSRAVRVWPRFWSTMRDVMRIERDSSFYNWRRSDWRVFVSDCYYTLARNLLKSGSA
jgi:predicted ATP-grasp superfamily ATP-dependent carboligase